MHPHYLLAVLFIPLLAGEDRLIGWGGDGRVKPMVSAMLAGGLLGYLALGAPFAITGILWAGFRALPFRNGALAPETGGARLATVFRYLFLLPLALPAYWAGGDLAFLALALALAGSLIVAMRFRFGSYVAELKAAGKPLTIDYEAQIELAGGALVGAAFAAYGAWSAGGHRLLEVVTAR